MLALAAVAVLAANQSVSGSVVDAKTGRPLGGVFIQQDGTLSSTFSGPDGSFSLILDRSPEARLSFSATGYERSAAVVLDGQFLKIKLVPLDVMTPQRPAELNAEAEQAPRTEPLPVLGSAVRLAYRVRYQQLNSRDASISGAGNNDYRLGLRYRWSPWLLDADGAHMQIPVDLNGLPREQNPAMSPSTYEAGARLGYVWSMGDWEPSLGLGYRYINTVPNNKDIPVTGSDLDFEQTRHGLGLTGVLGWRQAAGPWSAEAGLSAYPIVFSWAKEPGKPFAGQLGGEGHAGFAYELVSGLRLGLDYRIEAWRGDGQAFSHILAAQFQYTPSAALRGH